MAKRISFMADLTIYDNDMDYEPANAVEVALLRGDKHADYTLSLDYVTSVADVADDE